MFARRNAHARRVESRTVSSARYEQDRKRRQKDEPGSRPDESSQGKLSEGTSLEGAVRWCSAPKRERRWTNGGRQFHPMVLITDEYWRARPLSISSVFARVAVSKSVV